MSEPVSEFELGCDRLSYEAWTHSDQGGESGTGTDLDAEQLLICLLSHAGGVREIGERAAVLGYVMRLEGAACSLRDLAGVLGMSHTGARKRVSSFKALFRRELNEMVSKRRLCDE
jgi:hypothetical protein